MIEINGQKFEYRSDCPYKYDYRKVANMIATKEIDEINTLRDLILNDLFFIVFFVLKIPIANCPFVVKACREVEDGPKDFTLDVWAREHFKSTIITIAETIQYTLKNPDEATGFSRTSGRWRRNSCFRSRKPSRTSGFYTTVSPTLCLRTVRKRLRCGRWTRG